MECVSVCSSTFLPNQHFYSRLPRPPSIRPSIHPITASSPCQLFGTTVLSVSGNMKLILCRAHNQVPPPPPPPHPLISFSTPVPGPLFYSVWFCHHALSSSPTRLFLLLPSSKRFLPPPPPPPLAAAAHPPQDAVTKGKINVLSSFHSSYFSV